MSLDLRPDHSAVRQILDAQVQGPYRFIHHALIPYVRVAPATSSDTVTLTAGLTMMLLGGSTKRLTGADASVDFAVHFNGPGVILKEVPYQSAALNNLDIPPLSVPSNPHRLRHGPPRTIRAGYGAQEVPEGGTVEPIPTPRRTKPAPLRMVPADAPAATPEVSIPSHLAELCAREDIQPSLGDYLVVPPSQASHYEPRPAWVAVTEWVEQARVVKPRLGLDSILDEKSIDKHR